MACELSKGNRPCIDACNARTDKCAKHLASDTLTVGCVKLIGNLNTYCVGFETKCDPGRFVA